MATRSEAIEQLKSEVIAAQQAFRTAIQAYRKAAGSVPAFVRGKNAPPLRPEALTDCRVFSNRRHMMQALAQGRVGAEVGVREGNFARFMLDNLDLEKLHLFELEPKQIEQGVLDDPRTELHGGDSSDNLSKLSGVAFDWIYIDGDHSYQGAKRDAEAAGPLLERVAGFSIQDSLGA